MKKIIAAITTALLAVGVAVVGVAAPASASPAPVHNITSTCAALTVDLSGYADSVAEVPAVPAVDEVSHVEYQWMTWYKFQLVTKWAAVDPSHPGAFWWWTLATRTVIDVPAQAAVPLIPAKNNTVSVTIDGVQKENATTFGKSFSKVYTYANDYTTHDYSVSVTAWDNNGTYTTTTNSGNCTAVPKVEVDHLAYCHADQGSKNVFVKLDNSLSPVGVTFAGSGINKFVAAHATAVSMADPVSHLGGSFNITAAGQTLTVVVPPFKDCGVRNNPMVMAPTVSTCQLPVTDRTVNFVFDNTGSNRSVEFFIDGVSAATVPAKQSLNFAATAAGMSGHTYVVSANGTSWSYTVPQSDCLSVVTPDAPTLTTPATCGVYGTITMPSPQLGIKYYSTFDTVTKKYKVIATPTYGYKFAGLANNSQRIVYKGTLIMNRCVIDPVLTSTVTPVCGSADVLVTNTALSNATTRARVGTAKVWVDGVLSDRIRVKSGSDVTKTFTFAEDSTYNGGTQHDILVKFGKTQLATATVESNCLPPTVPSVNPPSQPSLLTFGAPSTTPTTPFTTPGESLTTLALLPASATATDQVCAPNGDKTSGYISVALLPEDQTAVQYSVDGTALTSAKTEMKPGSYTVTASPRDSGEGLTASSWNLTIASAADCAAAAANTVTTQQTADTGSGFPIWALLLIIFLVLLLLGVVFFLIARRRRREADAN